MVRDSSDFIEALRTLLQSKKATTQEDICLELESQGYEINQSKVSRLLRKIGAIKVTNFDGQTVYSLPREPAPPHLDLPIRNLILDIKSNEAMIVIFTSPGCASMFARILDHQQVSSGILGTIAGDDTLFVAPKSTKNIHKLVKSIQKLLKD